MICQKDGTISVRRRRIERNRDGFFVSGVVGLAILVGVAIGAILPRVGATGETARIQGGARLAVDRDLIDFGTVRYNQFVDARFRLKNVGDQPLQLPTSPTVEVVEGC